MNEWPWGRGGEELGGNILGREVLVLAMQKIGPELSASYHHLERKPFPCPQRLGVLVSAAILSPLCR